MRARFDRPSRIVSQAFWTLLTAVAAMGLTADLFGQDAGAMDSVKTKTVWEMLHAGGPILLILAVLSVVTLTLIVERFQFYRSVSGSPGELLHRIKQGATLSDMFRATNDVDTIAGRVMRVTIQAARDGYKPDEIEDLAQSAMTKEQISLEKNLPLLDSMVTMCPLLGLLGTTLGMIHSFSIVAALGMSDPTKLAGGISEALINTAAGLAVAIPALFAYNYFSGTKEAILMNMEKSLTELIVLLKAPIPQ
ncbi:MAG TPA: MotA/TolQ/ExbB proton channel family protein [Verrucomicrobiae bacterium]|nr:MotA/TolQ/ExbB proton channel family protein [Verrucomicrobiae bacterium]